MHSIPFPIPLPMLASLGPIVDHLNGGPSLEQKSLPDLPVKVWGNELAPKKYQVRFLLK